jgi:HSP20 family molecular chaperone IbpA
MNKQYTDYNSLWNSLRGNYPELWCSPLGGYRSIYTSTYPVTQDIYWDLENGKYTTEFKVPGYGPEDVKVEQDMDLGAVYLTVDKKQYTLNLPDESDLDVDVMVTVNKGILKVECSEKKKNVKVITVSKV